MSATIKLSVGDHVHWVSQAGGFKKSKEGVVVRVVPAGERAMEVKEPGFSRKHESYVIRALGRLYWPRVSQLVKLEPVS